MLVREQYYSLTRLVPVLYIVVIIATASLSFGFSGTVPAWLINWLPMAILVVVTLRLRYWNQARAFGRDQDMAIIRRDIRGMHIVGPLITLGFTLIGIGMVSYGDTYQQSLAAVSIWITAIISAFCLAALPSAAMMVVLCAGFPLAVSFLWSGNDLMMMLAGLFAIITYLVIYMLQQNYTAFRTIVQSRAEINKKHLQTEKARQSATELAYTDHLTNVANRRYFEDLLNERVSDPELRHKPFAVCIIDLDGFKPVNDVHGHRVGDGVLVEVAARMTTLMAGRGRAARMGGDEFAVLVEGVANEKDVLAFAKDVQKIFAAPFAVGDVVVQLSCCCGFAIYPVSSTNADQLINQADLALYRSKAQERGSASIFTTDYQKSVLERASIEQKLRLAVSTQAMSMHFQPILDLGSSRLTGFEALARWYDEELGHVSPATFIPIAEQIGLIEQLTDHLLRKAAATAVTWPDDLLLSFNLSAAQLVKPSAGLKILSILADVGLPPHRFEAEVTETVLMNDIEAARRTLECLKAAGVGISLDDFGTGYSSLSQIRDLPLDKVKIDKSFVDQICDAKMGNLVRAIISMCDSLELRCVAEGIEESAQLNSLMASGCALGQGYLFSRPVPPEQIAALLARSNEAAERAAA
jgi:diguanylate cyclase (GGDEF)-like protein